MGIGGDDSAPERAMLTITTPSRMTITSNVMPEMTRVALNPLIRLPIMVRFRCS